MLRILARNFFAYRTQLPDMGGETRMRVTQTVSLRVTLNASAPARKLTVCVTQCLPSRVFAYEL